MSAIPEAPLLRDPFCVVCQDGIASLPGSADERQITLSTCGHRFHFGCIAGWAANGSSSATRGNCPVCKVAMTPAFLVRCYAHKGKAADHFLINRVNATESAELHRRMGQLGGQGNGPVMPAPVLAIQQVGVPPGGGGGVGHAYADDPGAFFGLGPMDL